MNDFIEKTLLEAKKAFKRGEIPVGCVIVYRGKILSCSHNEREKKQNALLHAEIIAINKACKKLHSWRLDECEMYVSLEPCPMCAGAIANARIKKVYYLARERSAGDNLMDKIFSSNRLNHKVESELIENDDAKTLLTTFFKNKRKKGI